MSNIPCADFRWPPLGTASLSASWATVLGVGNVSGGTDPVLTSGDELQGAPGVGAGDAGDAVIRGGAAPGTGRGGAVQLFGGVSSAGIGGEILIRSGQGGAGAGDLPGAITIWSADAVAGSGADGGTLSLFAGTGVAGQDGGEVEIFGGDAPAGGVGGLTEIYGGLSFVATGVPGQLICSGGLALAGNQPGGIAHFWGGNGFGTGAGGEAELLGGDGGATGPGGLAEVAGGLGGATSGNGGQCFVHGGDAQTSGGGGLTTIRGGNAVGGNNVGGGCNVSGGASVGTGAGTSVVLSPGTVGTGARGRVLATHPGPDTDRVLELEATGSNGAAVQDFVGTRDPEGLITGNVGDLYRRDTGSVGEAYIKANGAVNTGWQRVGNVYIFDRATTDLTVNATTTETAIYSVSVPAGALGANGWLRIRLIGTFTSTAIAATLTVRVKFGGTTIYDDASPSIIASATSRGLCMDFVLVNRNATNAQVGGGNLNLSDAGGATVGIGNFGVLDLANATVRFATSAIDTTAARTFEITVQHSSNNAGITTVRNLAIAEISRSV